MTRSAICHIQEGGSGGCHGKGSVCTEGDPVRAGSGRTSRIISSDLQASGEIPLRVTHNDTKLNNIMIDNKTGKGICVIDLDTVMPGLAMNDFGDSIRFGASTAAEDEQDLDKASCSMDLFDLYAKGFIEGCAGKLTKKEIDPMPMGAKTMTFECGMRFLTDYLQGTFTSRFKRGTTILTGAGRSSPLLKTWRKVVYYAGHR